MYTVYQTTCLVNSKFYIGVHKTDDPNDDYLGSGKVLKRAIKKYGAAFFKKEVLHIFDDAKDAFLKEQELVTEALVASELCYNLKLGGQGGWEYNNDGSEEHRTRCSNAGITSSKTRDPVLCSKISSKVMKKRWKIYFDDMIEITKKNAKIKAENKTGMFSDIAIKNRIKKFKETCHQQGIKNSNYGSMWITDGINNLKIKNDSIIPLNWRKGRVNPKQKV